MLQREVYSDPITSPRSQHTLQAVTRPLNIVGIGSDVEHHTLLPFYISSENSVQPEASRLGQTEDQANEIA